MQPQPPHGKRQKASLLNSLVQSYRLSIKRTSGKDSPELPNHQTATRAHISGTLFCHSPFPSSEAIVSFPRVTNFSWDLPWLRRGNRIDLIHPYRSHCPYIQLYPFFHLFSKLVKEVSGGLKPQERSLYLVACYRIGLEG